MRPAHRRAVAVTCGVVASVVASTGHADEVQTWNDNLAQAVISRPHTVAEIEIGAIVLPEAPVSSAHRGGNLPIGLHIGEGDATIQLGMHLLYRGGAKWAIGASALFAPSPTSDSGYGIGGSSGLDRSHSRDYFFVGGEARYIPLHYRLFEGWLGAQAGAVVIADRFTTNNSGAYTAVALSDTGGYPVVNERTEGFSMGLQAGISYSFSDSFVVGFVLRSNVWLLPKTPSCDAIGDCATLNTTTAVFEGAFLFGYRLPL